MEKLLAFCVVQLKVTFPLPAARVAVSVHDGVVAVVGAVTVTVALQVPYRASASVAVPVKVVVWLTEVP